MKLLEFFQNPDWTRFQRLPVAVQRDAFALSSLHLGIQAAISRHVGDALTESAPPRQKQSNASVAARQLEILRESTVIRSELHLCLLSTLQGNAFSPIQWESFEPHRAAGILGALAMRQFRSEVAATAGLGIEGAGYSSKAIESEAQFMAVAANFAGITSWRADGRVVARVCHSIYRGTRNSLLTELPKRSAELMPRERGGWKAWLLALPTQWRAELFELAEALAKQPAAAVRTKMPATSSPQNPEVAIARLKREHPVAFIPLPKFVELQKQAEGACLGAIKLASLSEYEIQRLSGKPAMAALFFNVALLADCQTLATSIVIAAASTVDPEFRTTGGVSKAIFKLHDYNVCLAQALASNHAATFPGGALVTPNELSRLLELHRTSVRDYFRTSQTNRVDRIHALLQGTMLLRSIARSPKLEPLLLACVEGQISTIAQKIEELAMGELWDWPRQAEYLERAIKPRGKISSS